MYLLITGYPGTGKTLLSKVLGTKHKYKVINDKLFSINNKLGKKDVNEKEYVVDITKLNKFFNKFIKTYKNKNLIFEGHLWPEMSKRNLLKFNKIVLLKTDSKLLRKRYEKRDYSLIKIEENLLCEETNYIETILNSKGIRYIIVKTTNNQKKNINELEKNLILNK